MNSANYRSSLTLNRAVRGSTRVPGLDLRDSPARVPAANRHPNPELEGPTYRQLIETYGSPLHVLDCQALRNQYRKFAAAVPGAAIQFAVETLPHPDALSTLNEEGCLLHSDRNGMTAQAEHFDAAPDCMRRTHLIESDSGIRNAITLGCTTFLADGIHQLQAFQPYRDRGKVLLTVRLPKPGEPGRDSSQPGCAPEEVGVLLVVAQHLGITVCGLDIHFASQAESPEIAVAAIRACRSLIADAHKLGLAQLELLVLRGDFSLPSAATLSELVKHCAPIRIALETIPPEVRVIVEPNRYLASEAITSIASVIATKRRNGKTWYYLDADLCESHRIVAYDRLPPAVLTRNATGHQSAMISMLAGPTRECGAETGPELSLPELRIGDLIIGRMLACSGREKTAMAWDSANAKLLVSNSTRSSRMAA